MSSAHFKNGCQVDGDLSGPSITTINANATSTLNSLNSQIASHNAYKSETDQAFYDAENERTQMVADVGSTTNALQATMDTNKADADSKFAQEVSDRLALETKHDNDKSSIDTEIATLNTLHSQDNARLTSVETALASVDTDLQNQITSAVNLHNLDLDNALPRISTLESSFVIDDVAHTITIPAGYKFIVEGDFQNGV